MQLFCDRESIPSNERQNMREQHRRTTMKFAQFVVTCFVSMISWAAASICFHAVSSFEEPRQDPIQQ